MSKMNGALIISLDFELLWGVFDKVDPKKNEDYFRNTRKAIPEILKLFTEYNIHCTWATVGMLFNMNWNEWSNNLPADLPNYKDSKLSAYDYGKSVDNDNSHHLFFAIDLINQISKTPFQEIGTHTYSHYYCLEKGQNLNSFKSDLMTAIKLASQMNIDIKSLVFPRNQFNKDYLKICYDLGIENVRSNPKDWYWNKTQNKSLLNKIFRTGDAYYGLNNKSYSFEELNFKKEEPLAQKASRLLRPFSTNRIVNYLKLRRIKSEMTDAAKNNKIYHLWWHPHNFGKNTKENLSDLRILLEHYAACNLNYNFESMNMVELGSSLKFSNK